MSPLAVGGPSRKPLHPRRLLAVLVALTLALQLALAGRGATCVTSSGDPDRFGMTHSGSDMSGMDMSSHTHEAGVGTRQSPGQDHDAGGAPCDRSPAATSCQPFASCAAGIMVTDASAALDEEEVSSPPRVTDAPLLVSRTVAPELPPPRL